MTEYKTIKDLGDLNGKVVMLRADLNVPMDENSTLPIRQELTEPFRQLKH